MCTKALIIGGHIARMCNTLAGVTGITGIAGVAGVIGHLAIPVGLIRGGDMMGVPL